jgi:hypothetical protein
LGPIPQFAGAGWMHQIFPGSSSAIPTSQYLPSVPRGTQFPTRAGALVPPGSSSSKTGRPGSSGWVRRTPHPSVFTTRVWQCSLNGIAGSRLARRKGICARIRVLRRSASNDFAPELISGPSLIVRRATIFVCKPPSRVETKVTSAATRRFAAFANNIFPAWLLPLSRDWFYPQPGNCGPYKHSVPAPSSICYSPAVPIHAVTNRARASPTFSRVGWIGNDCYSL